MQSENYRAFIDRLSANLQADERVQGLVLLGSTASRQRTPDEWSDHDFFVITRSGTQEAFRTTFTWLPGHHDIVLTVRETAHGLKVLYASGHLLEYAVFDLAEIAQAKANDFRVVFDRGGVTAAVEAIAAVPRGEDAINDYQRDMGMFLCLLVVGAGRVARGEVISGQVFIRTYALGHLLPPLAHRIAATNKASLDNLDSFRRFEQVFPQAGAAINAALAHQPVEAGLGLLDIYTHYLADSAGYDARAVATVRAFLEGITRQTH